MFIDLPPNSTVQSQLSAPMVDGISAKLATQKTEYMTFPKTTFSFGIYKDVLTEETAQNYSPSGYGVTLGMQQHLQGIWSGGLEFMWSDWLANQSNANTAAPLSDTSPLSLFSKIEGSPSIQGVLGDKLGEIVKPYFTGGLGYTIFFDNRSFLAARTKSAFGQLAIIYGAGLRLTVPQSFAVKFSYEKWRVVQTEGYSADMYKISFAFGDVDNI